MLVEQQTAPDFSVADENNKTVNLADFNGSKNVVLDVDMPFEVVDLCF